MTDFSKGWNRSKQPRRQRKYIFNAPYHTRHKFLTAKVAEELSKKQGIKKIPIRKGDKVKILRGQFRGRTGKVSGVSLVDSKIFIEGLERTKIDGSKAPYPVTPSNVSITELNTEDKRRFKRGKNEKSA